MIAVIFLAAHWYISLFFHSFFHHRYAAHKQFTMSRGWEKFFFVASWIAQGTSYLSPWAYGVMHRMHHAYADTEKDPHSPKYDGNAVAMLWRTKMVFSDLFRRKVQAEERFTKGVPEWYAFDKFANMNSVRIAWIFVYVAFYYFFVPNYWFWLLLPLHVIIAPLQGVVVNWCAHKYGYRNFEVTNTSRNFLPVDILMMGESYHNNHHKFSSRANFGHRWHELDPVYPFILLFNKLNIVQLDKKAAAVDSGEVDQAA